ncbi:HAD-like domain-containing protein [Endogone sp. FLAS-F59071]|nr:HAD-like domain-containing protein [Endogone sp. FLAS-F59071]|eukprot:RUS15777.1 HAD-like domain-containing protein [Endogone sp. FLAS-F59071]
MPTRTFRTKCFLFDLDGTLIDTTPLVEAHWRAFAAEHNLDNEAILARSHGLRTIDTLRIFTPHLAVESVADTYEQALALKSEGVTLLPGVRDILDVLPTDRWAICTSARMYMAEARLRQCDVAAPRVLITADKVARGKPDPEGYTRAASDMGFLLEECIVVEDAPAGVKAAKAGGIRAIALLTTHRREQLLEAGADAIVRNLADVKVNVRKDGWIDVTVEEQEQV